MTRGEPDTLAAEIDFHLAVARVTHNQAQVLLFTTVQEAVHDLIVTVRGSKPTNVARSKGLAREHRAILEAIRKRDQELAASLMREHMRYADRALRAHFGMSDGDGDAPG